MHLPRNDLLRLLESLRSADGLEPARSVAGRMLQELIEGDIGRNAGSEPGGSAAFAGGSRRPWPLLRNGCVRPSGAPGSPLVSHPKQMNHALCDLRSWAGHLRPGHLGVHTLRRDALRRPGSRHTPRVRRNAGVRLRRRHARRSTADEPGHPEDAAPCRAGRFQLVFIAAHIGAALVPDFGFLLVMRVLSAMAYAGFWAMASVAAISLVDADKQGRAMGVVVSGLSVATIIGVPGAPCSPSTPAGRPPSGRSPR